MFQHFTTIFESADAPNPHDIAKAILTLINTLKGKRAARTVVGAAFGADKLNSATAPVQAEAIKSLGLDHLDNLRIA